MKSKTNKATPPKSDPDVIPVGRVSPKERDELQALFERKNGLIELTHSLVPDGSSPMANELFYEKIVADLGRATTLLQQWWDDKAKAYGWESRSGWRWTINFKTGEIFLQK